MTVVHTVASSIFSESTRDWKISLRCGEVTRLHHGMKSAGSTLEIAHGFEAIGQLQYPRPCVLCRTIDTPDMHSDRVSAAFHDWLDRVTSPKPWGEEEWKRASGESECDICGRIFYKHPRESGPGYGSCGDDILELRRLCDGSLVHL